MRSFLQKPLIRVLGITILILGGAYLLFGRSGQPVVQRHRSYEIQMVSSLGNIKPNQTVTIAYKIKDDQNNILKDFDIVHEKIMHFIVVRKDLQYFQHIHPEFNKATGEFSIPVTFATDGEYRMFADFTPSTSQMGSDGERLPVTLSQDVIAGNLANYTPQPLGSTERSKTFDGYTITMIPSSEPLASQNDFGFTFEIKKVGKPVANLGKYLGALGHTVVLKEGELQFIHAHPTQSPDTQQTGKVIFMITFPEAGNYKLFSQFQHEGNIITSDFVVSVIEGVKSSSGGMMMEGMQH
jgi:plastocyanin